MAHRRPSPSFCPCPIEDLIPLRLPARNSGLYSPCWVFLAADIICCEETVFIWEPLKIQAPIHLQFDILFPWACRRHLLFTVQVADTGHFPPRLSCLVFIFLCRSGWPVSNSLSVPPQTFYIFACKKWLSVWLISKIVASEPSFSRLIVATVFLASQLLELRQHKKWSWGWQECHS